MKKTLIVAMVATMALTGTAIAEEHGDGKRKGRMAKFDTDGNGKISQSEFLAKSQARFAKMDANNDGYLSRDEMKNARKKMRGNMKERRENRKASQSE